MIRKANHENEEARFDAPNVVASATACQSREWLKEFPILARPKTYRRALCDVILRTTFALTILAVGRWIPESYLDQIPWYYTEPVVQLAFLVSNFAACVYLALAIWSVRCVFAAMWEVDRNLSHKSFPDLL